MLRLLFCCALFLTATLSAQTLKVRATPGVIYAGDAFNLEVSANGASLKDVACTFTMPTHTIGHSTSMHSINGHVSTSQSLRVLPEGVGICQLVKVTAVTETGKTLTYQQPLQVEVRELVPDEAVSITTSVTPEVPLPGDEVTITLTIRAPAIQQNGRAFSPFLSPSIFGRLEERLPRLQFEAATGEDSPLRALSQPQLQSREQEGDDLVWTITCAYRAVRVGEQVFPAPSINDTRFAAPADQEQLEEVRCLIVGKPITVNVVAPPVEGRPEGFTGAVAERFAATVALDALNVKVGDPVKLTITFQTEADAEQIRMPQLPQLRGFRTYGEPLRHTIEGGCEFVYNLRPVQAGLLEIPSLPFAWFEKHSRAYQVTHTFAVPLYVHPSAQLVLMGEDGEALSGTLPPPLQLNYGELPAQQPRIYAWIVLCLGLCALIFRILFTPLRRIWYYLVQALTHRRPVRRVCAALRQAETPEVALAAIRTWIGRPALTSTEFRNLLEDSPAARLAVEAMTQLEHALYSGGQDVPTARACLVEQLPHVTFRHANKTHLALILTLSFTLLPAVTQAMPDAFVLEQAEALSLSATTPEDYAAAADLWLSLAREGYPSQTILLNAAGCAIFARHPIVAKRVIERYELLYGADVASEQALTAALERLEEPPFWGRTLFKAHYTYALALRLEVLCILVGVIGFLFACSLRGLKGLKVLIGISVITLIISVLVSAMQLTHSECYDALPTPLEAEVQP